MAYTSSDPTESSVAEENKDEWKQKSSSWPEGPNKTKSSMEEESSRWLTGNKYRSLRLRSGVLRIPESITTRRPHSDVDIQLDWHAGKGNANFYCRVTHKHSCPSGSPAMKTKWQWLHSIDAISWNQCPCTQHDLNCYNPLRKARWQEAIQTKIRFTIVFLAPHCHHLVALNNMWFVS